MSKASLNNREDEDGIGPAKGRIAELARLWRFVAPYKLAVGGAMVALVVAAVTVLFVGVGVRLLVDEGFSVEI